MTPKIMADHTFFITIYKLGEILTQVTDKNHALQNP